MSASRRSLRVPKYFYLGELIVLRQLEYPEIIQGYILGNDLSEMDALAHTWLDIMKERIHATSLYEKVNVLSCMRWEEIRKLTRRPKKGTMENIRECLSPRELPGSVSDEDLARSIALVENQMRNFKLLPESHSPSD
jgi:hypothetical protein